MRQRRGERKGGTDCKSSKHEHMDALNDACTRNKTGRDKPRADVLLLRQQEEPATRTGSSRTHTLQTHASISRPHAPAAHGSCTRSARPRTLVACGLVLKAPCTVPEDWITGASYRLTVSFPLRSPDLVASYSRTSANMVRCVDNSDQGWK